MRKLTAIVEGIEEGLCILEIDGARQDVALSLVSPKVKPGDVVVWDGHKWNVDPVLTEERTSKIRHLMEQVWED